jgi:hypothetical protein
VVGVRGAHRLGRPDAADGHLHRFRRRSRTSRKACTTGSRRRRGGSPSRASGWPRG